MLIFFIIPGFAKNVEDKYDEEEQETLVALRDFILYPIRQIMAKLLLHTQFVTFTLLHYAFRRGLRGSVCAFVCMRMSFVCVFMYVSQCFVAAGCRFKR